MWPIPKKEKKPEQEGAQTKIFDWRRSIDLHFNTIVADGRQMQLTLYYAGLNDKDWTLALRDSDKIDSIKNVAIEYLDNGYDAIKVIARFKNKSTNPTSEFIVRTSNIYMPLIDDKEERSLSGTDNMGMGLGIIEVQIDSVRKDSTIERLTDKIEDRDNKIEELKKENDELSVYIDELEDANKQLEEQVRSSRDSNSKVGLASAALLAGKMFDIDTGNLAGLIMGGSDNMPALTAGNTQEQAPPGRHSDEKIVFDYIKELNDAEFQKLSIIVKCVASDYTSFDKLIEFIKPPYKKQNDVPAQD